MARPTTALRLADIDPAAFGAEVERLVTDHATTLLMAVSIDATWQLPEHAGQLRHEATMLAAYAQRGLVGDWAHHGNAADALVAVCAALYTCAGRRHEIGGPDDVDVDPTDQLGIVILAAQARIRIDQKEPVPVRELACLAGVDPNHVRLLGRQGELAVVDGAVAAKVARRWLGARGVMVEA